MDTINIQYRFTMADGSQELFNLQLDAQNLELLVKAPESLPAWTNLEFHQCPNCPLSVHAHPHCPPAANLVNLVQRFEKLLSYDEIHLEVIAQERFYSQNTTAQRGISSLMGLIIATSRCPHTAFFKPMARFHLPLASEEETIYRATSMYLLAQYFLRQEGLNGDFEFKGLKEIYRNIRVVNTAIVKRLQSASETDSTINAVVLLDMHAMTLPMVIEESLEEISYLFAPFLKIGTGSGQINPKQ